MKSDVPSKGEDESRGGREERSLQREHRRRRFRRHRRRAYLRSVYAVPSLATLAHAISGFGAIYVASLNVDAVGGDPWTVAMAKYKFVVAAYLIFLAMVFDGLDGRLARFTRHTTDFGGQLDSLADVISFGAAPAMLALQVFKSEGPDVPFILSRLVWAIGALYMSCAAIRLARFNVANEHGEQHHFSFLGLPSPAAGGAVASLVLMQQAAKHEALEYHSQVLAHLSEIAAMALPLVVLATGLLMISLLRYPHIVNRYLRGRRSLARLVGVLMIALLLVVAHQYTLTVLILVYVMWGPIGWVMSRRRARPAV